MASFTEIVNSSTPTLVDFHATWCGPCKALTPIISEVASHSKGKAKVLKIDVDKNKALASKLGIRGVPTIAIYKNGKIVWRKSGVLPASEIIGELGKFID